jgi:cell division protein FtsW (lipid II flippase)
VTERRPDGGTPAAGRRWFDLEEFRRRNTTALAIDALYLFATAFLTTLFLRNVGAAVIAAVPLFAMLYFAYRSSTTFFAANLAAVALSTLATGAGILPL